MVTVHSLAGSHHEMDAASCNELGATSSTVVMDPPSLDATMLF
jgi:hypothetical protein